jgi:hypothetical protein
MQYISSQFYFTRFLSELRIKFWCKARFRFDLGWIFCNSVILLWLWKKDIICTFLQSGSVQYVLNVLFTFSIIKGFYRPIGIAILLFAIRLSVYDALNVLLIHAVYFIAILLYSISEWVADQILMQSPISILFGLNIL